MANGYMGKMLWVNLTSRKIEEEALDERLLRGYIGGYGLGARIIYSRQKAKVDALGPDNTLGFVTGPFTGTQALGGSRYVVVGKSPLTGTWGDANSGGYFGPALKFSGYDAVFFTGISQEPVYLFIDNGRASLRSAAHLWGKDSYETEDILKKELGNDVEISCIGPSGESRSLIAAVINQKGRAAGRSGLGALMGSKKLKAVVVRGDMKVPVFDEGTLNNLRLKYIPLLGGAAGIWRQFGTPGFMVACTTGGIAPVKNWSGIGVIDFPGVDKLSGEAVVSQQEKKYGCYRCVIACGGHMKKGTGEYDYISGIHKPEYETLGMFGPNCLNDNLESIIKANDICNRYGLDTISAGACIAFAIECYENGILSDEDTRGDKLTWGNHRAMISLLEKIARREGLGNILADGVKRASEKIGKGSDRFAMHIQGQEYPARDPKSSYPLASGYLMDATPGRHTRDGDHIPPGLPLPDYDPNAWSGRGEVQRICTNYKHVVDSAGCCMFLSDSYPNAWVLVEFLNSITGWNFSMEDVINAGERIANIRHLFNIREGFNPLKYTVPDRIAGRPPFKEGPLAGVTLDEKAIAREYCEAMGWDLNTAVPDKKRLIKIGMEDIANSL